MEKNNAEKIQKVSRVLKWIVTFLIAAFPIANASFWLLNGFPSLSGLLDFQLIPNFLEGRMLPLSQLSPMVKFCGFLVNLLPVAIAMAALSWLRKLFLAYERLVFFSSECVRYFRNMGWTLLAGQLLYPFYCALISLTLTLTNPPGQRMISIAFGLHQAAMLTIALAMLLISWIMDEGKKLQEEQEATI